MTDPHDLDARLRENERVTALQGQTLGILVEDAKQHASKETVQALDDLTRNQLVPDVAVLKARMDTAPRDWLDRVLGFVERAMDRRGFRFAAGTLLVFGCGLLLYSCSDRILDIGDRLVRSQQGTEEATTSTAESLEAIRARAASRDSAEGVKADTLAP